MTKITPFLWFEHNAGEAMNFYASVFKDSAIGEVHQFGNEVPGPEGEVMTGTFTICGQEFMVLNGGPNGDQSKFTEAISFMVQVDDQAEVDYYWEALTADGGKPGPCGWLNDKYGLSWQIVPKQMFEFMSDPDPEKSKRTTEAMLKMGKLDIAALQAAHDGE